MQNGTSKEQPIIRALLRTYKNTNICGYIHLEAAELLE
jgi:hypothetical protein